MNDAELRTPLPREPYPWYRVRNAQYDEIYVSPHMDDAIYSCGGQIALARAAGAQVLVLTLFGNGSRAARGRGVFGDIVQRKREERAAMQRLDLDHIWLNYPEILARPKRWAELARYALPFLSLAASDLYTQLYAALEVLSGQLLAPDGRVYFPLSIGAHPDHRLAFEVGRTLSALSSRATAFYEDIPYAQVPAVRDERLRQLGLVEADAARGVWRAAQEIDAFVFARAPRWQRRLTAPLVLGQLATTRGLIRLFGRGAAQASWFELAEREIDEVVGLKVAAMRDYETQTEFFFPAGDAIYDVLSRSGGHYVERYWRLGPERTPRALPPRPQLESYRRRERAKLDALLAELARTRAARH